MPVPEKQKKNIPWGMLYILATVIAVVLFGVFNREYANVFRVFGELAPGFLVIAALVKFAYFCFEAGILQLLMRSQNVPMKLGGAMKISLIGLYYSAITPSATGGQPMQVAYLLRDRVPAGVSSAVLIMKFFCFQCGFFFCALGSVIGMYGKLAAENPGILPFIFLGLAVNGASILFFPCLFIKPVMGALCRLAKWLVQKLGFLRKRQDRLYASIEKFQGDFGGCSDEFQGKLGSVLLGILLSVPQFLLEMSVIYFVFLSFGYGDIGYWEVFAVQTLLQVSVNFMPMPGASGAQEIGFASFFRSYFVNNDLYAAVMVWRFLTYYLVILAGALLVVADQLLYARRKKSGKDGGEG